MGSSVFPDVTGGVAWRLAGLEIRAAGPGDDAAVLGEEGNAVVQAEAGRQGHLAVVADRGAVGLPHGIVGDDLAAALDRPVEVQAGDAELGALEERGVFGEAQIARRALAARVFLAAGGGADRRRVGGDGDLLLGDRHRGDGRGGDGRSRGRAGGGESDGGSDQEKVLVGAHWRLLCAREKCGVFCPKERAKNPLLSEQPIIHPFLAFVNPINTYKYNHFLLFQSIKKSPRISSVELLLGEELGDILAPLAVNGRIGPHLFWCRDADRPRLVDVENRSGVFLVPALQLSLGILGMRDPAEDFVRIPIDHHGHQSERFVPSRTDINGDRGHSAEHHTTHRRAVPTTSRFLEADSLLGVGHILPPGHIDRPLPRLVGVGAIGRNLGRHFVEKHSVEWSHLDPSDARRKRKHICRGLLNDPSDLHTRDFVGQSRGAKQKC